MAFISFYYTIYHFINLVRGLEHFLFSHIIIRNDNTNWLIFFRGVGIPPTRYPIISYIPMAGVTRGLQSAGFGRAEKIERHVAGRDFTPKRPGDQREKTGLASIEIYVFITKTGLALFLIRYISILNQIYQPCKYIMTVAYCCKLAWTYIDRHT